MKNFNRVLKTLTLIAMIAISCNKDLTTSQELQDNFLVEFNHEEFISTFKATKVAEAFLTIALDVPITKSNLIASTETIRDSKDNNKPLMHVINYTDGGFVIVCATKDYYPILAFSDKNNFVVSQDIGNLVVWLEETEEAIRQSKTLSEENKVKISSMWRIYDPKNQIDTSSINTKNSSQEKDDAMNGRIAELNMMGYSCYTLEDAFDCGLMSYNLYEQCLTYAHEMGTSGYTLVVLGSNYNFSKLGPLVSTKWVQQNGYNDSCSNYP